MASPTTAAPGTGELGYAEAVSAWAAHLRGGGTTTWSAWHPGATPSGPVLHPVPDAIHLELVRRINLAAAERGPVPLPGLADRVYATPAPGRGLLDVPLPWPEAPRRFGTPALDPALVPAEELVRLAVGVLAHLLPDVTAPRTTGHVVRWRAPWRRRRFRLHGSPATVDAVRRSLLAQGYVETDWRPTHVVIARPVEVMMAEQWATSVHDGGILKWSTSWRRAEAAGRLPDPIDVVALTRRLRDRRREPLHVVVSRDADTAARLAAQVLGARPTEVGAGGDAALSDLLRRLNRLTALTQGDGRVRALARTLVALLAPDLTGEGESPVTPPPSLPWALQVAATTAEELRNAGYPVHGDPGDLVPTEHRLPGTIDRERTLELAVAACLRTWNQGGRP